MHKSDRKLFAACLSLIALLASKQEIQAAPISSPTVISGTKLWLDGNDVDGDGIAEGAGESFVVSGTATWIDKSAAGTNHATQSTGNLQPTVIPTGLNSQGVVRFDGGAGDANGDYLNLPNFASGFTSATGFVVFVANGNSVDPSQGRNGGVWNFGSSTASNHFGIGQVYDDFGIATRPLVQNSITASTPYLYTVELTGTDFIPTFNTVLADGSSFPLTASPSWSTSPTLGQITNYRFNGDIAEVIIFDRVLSDGSIEPSDNEMNDVWFYLQEKWNLSLGLSETPPPPPAPEPSSLLLIGLGTCLLSILRRHKGKQVAHRHA